METNHTMIPEPVQYARPDKNLCRICGHDFATLTGFDLHRKDYYIRANQEYAGYCISPEDMGYVFYNGYWYTPEGAAQAAIIGERLKKARAARGRANDVV